MIRLYKMNVSGIDTESVYGKLSKKRREKLDRLKNELNRRQSAGAELLLNAAVGELCPNAKPPVKWDTDENGKLFLLEYPKLFVNLSHSKDYAVCAVSDMPVGVDIECAERFDMALAERFFTDAEADFIRTADDPADAFYRIWVKKESLIKADGRGLGISLNSFCVLGDTVCFENKKYKFYERAFDNYRISVCQRLSF